MCAQSHMEVFNASCMYMTVRESTCIVYYTAVSLSQCWSSMFLLLALFCPACIYSTVLQTSDLAETCNITVYYCMHVALMLDFTWVLSQFWHSYIMQWIVYL